MPDQQVPLTARWMIENEQQGVFAETARLRPFHERIGYRFMETRSTIAADPGRVLDGWTPPEPLIHPDTRVVAFGSCFAYNFIEWLHRRGFFNDAIETIIRDLVRNPFESVAAVSQQFRWAFGEVPPTGIMWFDTDKQLVVPTEEQRLAIRRTLEEAEVFIATIGVSEYWYDNESGESLWRVPPEPYFEQGRLVHDVLSVSDTVAHLEIIERLRREHLPRLKVIYSVSPLRMHATKRPISPITANSASKAIARAGLDEFLRGHWDLVGSVYFYFPGYELALDVLDASFDDDNRHISDDDIARVLALFAEHYTSLAGDDAPLPPKPNPAAELASTQEALARKTDDLEALRAWATTLERERERLQADVDEMWRALSARSEPPASSSRIDKRVARAYASRSIRANLDLVLRKAKRAVQRSGEHAS